VVRALAAVDRLADGYVGALAALDPIAATQMGVGGQDRRLTDYSPEGHDARASLARRTLRESAAIAPLGRRESVALALLTERLNAQLALHDAGLTKAALNTVACPVQHLRTVFAQMPGRTAEDWATIGHRLRELPGALSGLSRSLASAARDGHVVARAEVLRVADQCAHVSGDNPHELSEFEAFAANAWRVEGAPVGEIQAAARSAADAFGEFAAFLRTDLAPSARECDGVGEDDYRLWLRYFLGADLDPYECYAWGLAELDRLETEARQLAHRIAPGCSPHEVADRLDHDPALQVHGCEAYLRWLQDKTDDAVAYLAAEHFEISPPAARLDCLVSAEPSVPAFYTAPSAGFARPGRLWWAVAGEGPFSTWRDITRIHHEGAPGHHLQRSTLVARADRLNAFQRLAGEVAAHGEGWAVYAEGLMADWGRVTDDAHRFGLMDGHLLRAARVVVDIGLHLALPVPGAGPAGQRWTPEYAVDFLRGRTTAGAQCAREVHRCLGWPGQAPSYKLGERAWLAARAAAEGRLGAGFDLAAFHRDALELGPMGLDLMESSTGLAATDHVAPSGHGSRENR
jgi:uncharacterized protein (DUF885 family)